MRKKTLAVALAGLALPALALAAQPLLIHFDGRTVPMHETVQVTRTAAGPVQVRTWSWHGPGGAATIRVSESSGAAMPAWAQQQMRAMQAQMRQMQQIQTALDQQLLAPSLPMPTAFGQPLLMPLPALAPPVEVRFPQLLMPTQVMPQPARVIVILPGRAAPQAAPKVPAPARHKGQLV
jgi:hypothetical protein